MDSFVSSASHGECPHCGTYITVQTQSDWEIKLETLEEDPQSGYEEVRSLRVGRCPKCKGLLIDTIDWQNFSDDGPVLRWNRVYPIPPKREAPPEVPDAIRQDYAEAVKVAPISSRAAAALARRCLQGALRERNFVARSLDQEIEAAQKASGMPSTLFQKLHIVRQVGNYAAHPMTTAAGEMLDVEPGEVEALIGALDELFDHFYVRPEQHKKMLSAINAKLKAAGKPPIT